MITIDDFKKIELKVAKVLEAERVEGSEKLIKMQLDAGEDPSANSGRDRRQVLAGIAQYYKPEELVGREIVIVANLEPRKLMGFESNGMLLAAGGEEGAPVILIPEKEVPPGSGIR